MWKAIDKDTPQDELILLKKEFPNVNTPCVVVGEITTFKGEVHHLWRGGYTGVVDIYKEEVDSSWDEKFTHWMEL